MENFLQQEWEASGVSEEIIALNVEAIPGAEAFDRIYGRVAERLNAGRLNSKWLNIYRKVDKVSGWWVSGIDPQTWQPMEWGRFKPTKGEIRDAQGKPVKYFSPQWGPKSSRLILLQVPDFVWVRASENFGIPLNDEDYAHPGGFWHWVLERNVPVILCEGEKKAGCLLSLGYPAIALPGIWNGRRKPKVDGKAIGVPHLIPDLKLFDTPERTVTICFDYDATEEKRATTLKAAIATGECFKKANVKIAFLPGPEKGVDDFVVARNASHDPDDEELFDLIGELLSHAKKLSWVKAQESWKLTYPVNLKLNQRYLGKLPFPESGLVAVKSPKGTGKTESLKGIVDAATSTGRRVLLVTHRIVLGKGICDRLGIPYISEVLDGTVEEKRLFGFGLCIDSLHPEGQGRINPKDWEGAIVIIDEVEQVLWHALNASTCYEKRVKILKTFKELVRVILSTGGLIIVQDADLSDLSIDLIRKQCDFNVYPWVAVNTWKPETGPPCIFFNTTYEKGQKKDDPSGLLENLVDRINGGENGWLQADSQKPKSVWGTCNLERYLLKHCPDAKILRYDAETVADPNHPAFGGVENLNAIVGDYNVVIASPTLATGVSVDIKGHFAFVAGIFMGATPANECLQALARVREPVTRLVWARKRAVSAIGNGSDSLYGLIHSKHKDIKTNVRLLQEFDLFDFDLEEAHDPVMLRTWAKMAARINAAVWDFRESIKEGLIAEGYRLLNQDESNLKMSKAISESRDELWEEYSLEVESASDFDESQFSKLQDKRSRTEPERLAERKYLLKQRYGVEVSAPLVKLDDDRWHPQIRLHYYLTHDFDYLKLRDRKHLQGHVERGEGKVCLQDIKLLSAQAKMLQQFGILRFTEPDREWRGTDPEVQELFALLRTHRQHVKDILGVTISEKLAPVQAVQNLLAKIGLKMSGKQQRREADGERERVYRFGGAKAKLEREKAKDLRMAIFTEWEERDQTSLNEWLAQSETESEKSNSVTPQIINTDTTEGVTLDTGEKPADARTSWRGLLVRVRDRIEDTSEFAQRWVARLPKEVLRVVSEPHPGLLIGQWLVWCEHALGLVSVPCDWIEAIA